MYLVQNERTKLTAAWFSTLATAIVTAGTLAPLVAAFYGLSTPSIGSVYLVVMAVACFIIGLTIHLCARMLLGRLQE